MFLNNYNTLREKKEVNYEVVNKDFSSQECPKNNQYLHFTISKFFAKMYILYLSLCLHIDVD